MAAIISQIAANNRKKKLNKFKTIPIDKSVYKLPPFDACYDPSKHNRFIKYHDSMLAKERDNLKLNEFTVQCGDKEVKVEVVGKDPTSFKLARYFTGMAVVMASVAIVGFGIYLLGNYFIIFNK